MEKNDLMKEYEIKIDSIVNWGCIPIGYAKYLESELIKARAKAAAYDRLVSKTIMSDAELDAPLAQKILREMCEKAEAYDRVMSGGKKTLTNKKSFSSDEFLEEVKKFLIGYGFYLTDMEMTVTPKPTESEYGFMKYAIGKRQIVITGEVDWIDKEITK